MSKSVKGMSGQSGVGVDESPNGFYLYEDGVSYWGMNILRLFKAGVLITEELHKKPVADKIAWYNEDAAKKEKAYQEAEVARKAKEEANK